MFGVSFSIGLQVADDYLLESEPWNHCRIQTAALGGERTGEDDDAKSFSSAHELEYRGVKISWGR